MAVKIFYEYWDPPNNTRIKTIKYFNQRGQYHRPWQEGPAYIDYYYYYGRSCICFEAYFENGKYHRPHKEGPAWLDYRFKVDETLWRVIYCENDKEIKCEMKREMK